MLCFCEFFSCPETLVNEAFCLLVDFPEDACWNHKNYLLLDLSYSLSACLVVTLLPYVACTSSPSLFCFLDVLFSGNSGGLVLCVVLHLPFGFTQTEEVMTLSGDFSWSWLPLDRVNIFCPYLSAYVSFRPFCPLRSWDGELLFFSSPCFY